MAELILHHYPTSPFAEKVRLMMGFKRLAWHSVVIPMTMPKPDLTALTGGYRKTPVLQIGADIYCDTALICDVLEQLAPTPTLYPEADKGAARIVAQWAAPGPPTLLGDGYHCLVTEHGVAHLHGLSSRARAMAIARVAHPMWRDVLMAQAQVLDL